LSLSGETTEDAARAAPAAPVAAAPAEVRKVQVTPPPLPPVREPHTPSQTPGGFTDNASPAAVCPPVEERPSRVPPADDDHTVALVKKKIGIDPVVGWLVCVEGAEKGKDYRIHTEKNKIGRSENMDIIIKSDSSISRENHAFIVFNPRQNIFRVQSGESRGLIYVNGEEVLASRELAVSDIIEIGEGKYRFVPFCGENFTWDAATE
jgi:hypothetical protein